MKKRHFLPMFITVLFLIPVMVVCQVHDFKLTHKAGKQTIYAPLAPNYNLLYGQLSSPSNEGGIASQDFTDYPEYSCQAADDFIVPTGEMWTIDEIFFSGAYSTGGGIAQQSHLFIYSNDPALNIPASTVITYLDHTVTATTGGDLTFNLTTDPIILVAGHYWISVQPHMAGDLYGQWFWYKQESPTILNEFHWRNPGGGFGIPGAQNWLPGHMVIGGSDHNLTFGLYGTVCTPSLPVSVSISASANPVCTGTSVTFTATPTNGGTSPTYQWMKGNNAISGATNVTYTYVPDNGDVITCILTSNVVCATGNPATSNAVAVDMLSITGYTKHDVSCFGGIDGSISVTVSGGATPYSYLWNNGGTTQGISGLHAGFYQVTVTDSQQCLAPSSWIVSEPPQISITYSITSLPCSNNISLTVSGGISPYNYLWSNQVTKKDLINAPAGTYTVVVTDSYLCQHTITIVTTAGPCDFGDAPNKDINGAKLPVPYPTLLADNGACAKMTSDFRMGISITDAETDGQPDWWAQGDDNNNIADEYGVSGISKLIIGNNLITIHTENSLDPNVKKVYISGWIDFNGDHIWDNDINTEKVIDNLQVPQRTNHTITVLIKAPTTSQNMFGRFRISDQPDIGPDNPPSLPDKIPYGEVEDYKIEQVGIDSVIACKDGLPGGLNPMVNIQGGVTPYIYHWTSYPPGFNSYLQSPVPVPTQTTTTYQLILTDATGHLATGQTQVKRVDCDYGDAPQGTYNGQTYNYPTKIDPTFGHNGAAHFYDPGLHLGVLVDHESDGQPDLLATGDDINPANSDDEDGVALKAPGYIDYGRMTQRILPSQPGFLNAWIDFNTNSIFNDNELVYNNVYITPPFVDLYFNIPSTVRLGTKTYARYRFTPLEMIPPSPIDLNQKGEVEDYQITIMDDRPPTIMIIINKTNVSCYGGTDGAVEASGSGGVSPYSFLWSNGSTAQNIYGLPAGQYFVTMTDFNGTSLHDSVTIYQFTPQAANAGPDQLNIPDNMITLQGNRPVSGNGTWTVVSGSGGTVADASNPYSNFSGQPGTGYLLRWTLSNSCSTSHDDVAISFGPSVHPQLPLNNVLVGAGQVKCYNASQIITVAGGGTKFIVDSGGSTEFIAGQKILFLPGTYVLKGGEMHGHITQNGQYCPPEKNAEIVNSQDVQIENQSSSFRDNSFFKIYPNPTTGGFSLELKDMEEASEVKVEMYGIYGERLLNEELAGMRKYDFSLAGKPNGIYFIRVVTGKFAGTGKIIKQ